YTLFPYTTLFRSPREQRSAFPSITRKFLKERMNRRTSSYRLGTPSLFPRGCAHGTLEEIVFPNRRFSYADGHSSHRAGAGAAYRSQRAREKLSLCGGRTRNQWVCHGNA